VFSALIIFFACNSVTPCFDGYLKDASGNCVIDESYTSDAAPWSIQNIEQGVTELLEFGIPEPLLVRDVYLEAMYSRDADCPPMEMPGQALDNPIGAWNTEGGWSSGCQASSGWRYDGGAIFEEDGVIEEGEFLSRLVSSFTLTAPTGHMFSAGGELIFSRSSEGVWDIQLGGVYQYDGDPGWISEITDVALWFIVSGQSVVFDGGISRGVFGIHFHGLSYGVECTEAPFGDVSVRDELGRWYRISFDDSCDGCGDVSLSGANLGRACLPISEQVVTLLERFGEPS
jgi:hypothetical protein